MGLLLMRESGPTAADEKGVLFAVPPTVIQAVASILTCGDAQLQRPTAMLIARNVVVREPHCWCGGTPIGAAAEARS